MSTMRSLLQAANADVVRDTGKALLVLAAFLGAAGRRADAARVLSNGVTLLEHAAAHRRRAV
jgi:hypothetical protein